ncbi:MAG: hypothetical protein KKC77_19820 [Proteobacteria bacterium]|nr:hypothetical protein [Pseudomonadota bacterium]
MVTYVIPDVNTTGADAMLVSVATAVPIFTPFLLLFIYMVVFLTGYKNQKISSGFGDAPLWATVSGISTSVVALILSTKEGLISLPVLIIPILLTIISAIWLFSSRDRI